MIWSRMTLGSRESRAMLWRKVNSLSDLDSLSSSSGLRRSVAWM